MNRKMYQGLIITKNGKFVFRWHETEYWAWEIHDCSIRGVTYKWEKLPNGEVFLFDIDCPPQTVSYLPILN